MSRLLLIDDDVELCEMLVEYLTSEDFSVDCAHEGLGGVQLALSDKYDVIILDVMLPNLSGFEVLQRIRAVSKVPILMLTARGDDIDRIIGLEMGSDDYLPKPCNPRELLARLRAILRRTQSEQDLTEITQPEIYRSGDIEMTSSSRRVSKAGEILTLTSTEYNLLEVLIRNVGHVVSKATLSEQGLGRKLARYDRSIDMHISKLRRKLGSRMDDEPLIQTVRGIGYQLVGE